MNKAEQLLYFLTVAKILEKDFGDKGFTINEALKTIDDCYPGLKSGVSRELCRETLAKVIEKAPTSGEKPVFGHEEKFLLTPAIKGVLGQAIKSKSL